MWGCWDFLTNIFLIDVRTKTFCTFIVYRTLLSVADGISKEGNNASYELKGFRSPIAIKHWFIISSSVSYFYCGKPEIKSKYAMKWFSKNIYITKRQAQQNWYLLTWYILFIFKKEFVNTEMSRISLK